LVFSREWPRKGSSVDLTFCDWEQRGLIASREWKGNCKPEWGGRRLEVDGSFEKEESLRGKSIHEGYKKRKGLEKESLYISERGEESVYGGGGSNDSGSEKGGGHFKTS